MIRRCVIDRWPGMMADTPGKARTDRFQANDNSSSVKHGRRGELVSLGSSTLD